MGTTWENLYQFLLQRGYDLVLSQPGHFSCRALEQDVVLAMREDRTEKCVHAERDREEVRLDA
jgi:hypothetical protein